MLLKGLSDWSRRRRILTLVAAGAAAAVVAVVLVWLFVWRGDAPPPPSVVERSTALTATTVMVEPAPQPEQSPPPDPEVPPTPTVPADATADSSGTGEPLAEAAPTEPPPAEPPPGTPPDEAPPAEPAVTSDSSPSNATAEPTSPPTESAVDASETDAGVDLDGVWSVDTTLGSFDDYTSSWAGYRVGEELSGIGTTDAVGRTPAVSGTLEIAGSTVVSAAVEVDLTTIVSDRPRRDGLVQRALDTQQFPLARFELTEPVAFEALPAAGEAVTATVAGTFAVRGASHPVEIFLEATWIDGVVIVGGAFEIRFDDYGISPPRAPIVLSVEDVAAVEVLLNFTR
jgi:polyisoprenoid-binding protein YceI